MFGIGRYKRLEERIKNIETQLKQDKCKHGCFHYTYDFIWDGYHKYCSVCGKDFFMINFQVYHKEMGLYHKNESLRFSNMAKKTKENKK